MSAASALDTGTQPSRFILNGVEVRELGGREIPREECGCLCVRRTSGFMLTASVACLNLLARRELQVRSRPQHPRLPGVRGSAAASVWHEGRPRRPRFGARRRSPRSSQRGPRFGRCSVWKSGERPRAHRVICVNHPQRDTLVARGIPGSKTFISMNMPDPQIFKPSAGGDRSKPERTRQPRLPRDDGSNGSASIWSSRLWPTARSAARLAVAPVGAWRRSGGVSATRRELNVGRCASRSSQRAIRSRSAGASRGMDLGVVGNRRSVACDLVLPVKLLEYVSLGIPAVVPRLKTIEHYFSDDMVAITNRKTSTR